MFSNKTQIVQLNDSEWMRLIGRRVYKGRRRSRIRSGRRRKFFYDQIFISKLTECRPCSSLPLEIWNKNVNIYYLMTLAVISSLVLSSRCASRWQSRPRLGGNQGATSGNQQNNSVLLNFSQFIRQKNKYIFIEIMILQHTHKSMAKQTTQQQPLKNHHRPHKKLISTSPLSSSRAV